MTLFSFFQKDCEICRTKGVKDLLIFPSLKEKNTRKYLCRTHFFEEYKKAFLSHPYKMVVLYPNLIKWNSVYSFYAISELKKYYYEDADIEIAKRIINAIPARKDCAYFDRESKSVTLDIQSPSLLQESDAQFLTKEEAINKILAALSSTKKNFSDGFYAPHDEEGVFLTSLL